jgi:hypothetical protein
VSTTSYYTKVDGYKEVIVGLTAVEKEELGEGCIRGF